MRCPPRAAVGLLWPTALGLLPSSSFRVQSAFSLLGMLRGRLSPDASSPAILLAPGGGRFGHSMQSPQKRCRQAPQFVQFGPPYGTLVAPNRRAAGHMMRELYSLKLKETLGALKGPLGTQQGSPGPLGGVQNHSPGKSLVKEILQNAYKTCVILTIMMFFCKILNISLEVLQKKSIYYSGLILTCHFCDT